MSNINQIVFLNYFAHFPTLRTALSLLYFVSTLNPSKVIMGSAIGIVMNGTLLGQILMYQKPAPKKEKKED